IMADLNTPTNDAPVEQATAVAPPTRTDDQILPLSKWVPIGKSNCVLDVHKPQRNPIFLIVVALLKNINFFRAFTEEAHKKKRKKHAAPRTPSGSPPSPPPPLPSPIGPSGAPGISGASGSSHLPPHPPPLSTGTSGSAQQQGSKAPSLSKPTASTHQSM
ncbi:hypothetical protein Tco_1271451, partial [Tanacetum coccineum]